MLKPKRKNQNTPKPPRQTSTIITCSACGEKREDSSVPCAKCGSADWYA